MLRTATGARWRGSTACSIASLAAIATSPAISTPSPTWQSGAGPRSGKARARRSTTSRTWHVGSTRSERARACSAAARSPPTSGRTSRPTARRRRCCSSGEGSVGRPIAAAVRGHLVALEDAALRQEEEEDRRRQAEGLEVDPGLVGHRPPDRLVENREPDEEGGEPAGQDHPALVLERHHLVHHEREVAFPPQEAEAEQPGEEEVDERRLHLEEAFVVEPDRETAEDDDEHECRHLHRREPPGQPPEDEGRHDQQRPDSGGGQDETALRRPAEGDGMVLQPRECHEEGDDGTEFEPDLQPRIDLPARHVPHPASFTVTAPAAINAISPSRRGPTRSPSTAQAMRAAKTTEVSLSTAA